MKIGLFGGAFNPPHLEHVMILDEAKKTLGLDKSIVFPSYLPPHKRTADSTPFEDRMNMCKIAFSEAEVSDIEFESEDTNYTVNTLKKFKAKYPTDKLYFIIGGDSMADIFKWYKPEEIFKSVELVVYPRDGRISDMNNSIEKAKKLGANITVLHVESQNFSSGEIRCLSSIGASLDGLVSDSVQKYISDHNLYTTDLLGIIRDRVSDRTYMHSLRTAVWALKLNRKLSLDTKEVFEASLLHDIAKSDESVEGVPNDAKATPVAHQFRGAEVLERLGFSKNVVEAVRYHTTGRADMTLLQKLIFCADMTEEGRSYEGVEQLRQALLADFEDGFRRCVERTYEFLVAKGADIYYLTKDAYQFYKDE